MLGKWDAKVSVMEFWGDLDALLELDATAGDENLPNIVVAGIPSGATLLRVVGMLTYAKREEGSGSDNYTEAAQVISIDSSSGRDSVVTMINLPNQSMHTTASATETGAPPIIGDNDVKAEVTGNGTYYVTWELADAHGASLYLYDVQVGLRVYFN